MKTAMPWINGVLNKFQLREKRSDDLKVNRYRRLVERSHLVEKMSSTCESINSHAGERIIYGEMFISPHPIAWRHVYETDNKECRMSLTIRTEGPTLVFSWVKPKEWMGSVQRCFGYYAGERNHVVWELMINPLNIKDADVQGWFTYLLSGLRHSFRPPKDNSHRHAQWV
jgi:hypothetical protein